MPEGEQFITVSKKSREKRLSNSADFDYECQVG